MGGKARACQHPPAIAADGENPPRLDRMMLVEHEALGVAVDRAAIAHRLAIILASRLEPVELEQAIGRRKKAMPRDLFRDPRIADYEMRLIRGHSWLRWKGTADTLLMAAEYVPPQWDERGMATFARYTGLRSQRRYRDILDMLDLSRSELSTDGLVYHPKALMRAEAYHGLGDENRARHHYELAREVLASSSAADPSNAAIHSALGLAYAGLGRKQDAIREAERAMELVPVTVMPYRGSAFMGLAVEIFARVGEFDRAFEMIDLMLTMPSGREISIPYLRVWPSFDPLRSDPRFDDVIRRYAALYPTRPG